MGSGGVSGRGNGNYRHGLYTAGAVELDRMMRAWARAARTEAASIG